MSRLVHMRSPGDGGVAVYLACPGCATEEEPRSRAGAASLAQATAVSEQLDMFAFSCLALSLKSFAVAESS